MYHTYCLQGTAAHGKRSANKAPNMGSDLTLKGTCCQCVFMNLLKANLFLYCRCEAIIEARIGTKSL